jgi:hypothetical protein
VAEREADILELMQRAHALSYPADYLLRAQHNRCLPQGGKLWPATLAAAPLGDIEFILSARVNQPARPVRQTLHVRTVDLPKRRWGARRKNALARLRQSQQLRQGRRKMHANHAL